MAAQPKTNFNSGPFTWDDVFNTQDALDSGILNSVTAGKTTTYTTTEDKMFGVGLGNKRTDNGVTTDNSVGASDFKNTILGGADAIDAYKKRKTDQTNLRNQGNGRSQSILGGSVI